MKRVNKLQVGRVTENERDVIHNYAGTKNINWDCTRKNQKNCHHKNLSLLIAMTWPNFAHLYPSFGIQSTFKSLSPKSGNETSPMSAESAVETEKTYPHDLWRLEALASPLAPRQRYPHAWAWRLHYEMLPLCLFLKNTCNRDSLQKKLKTTAKYEKKIFTIAQGAILLILKRMCFQTYICIFFVP